MKKKPVLFTSNTNVPHIHSLSKSTEVNGFELQKQHNEKVSKLLDEASQSIILDVKLNKPAKQTNRKSVHVYHSS